MGKLIVLLVEGCVSLAILALVLFGIFTFGKFIFKGIKASISKEGK
jgi:hypothetical protein